MILPVSDVRSNPNDQIAHAARVLGKSKPRTDIFIAIYKGKKRIKTVKEIEEITNIPRKRILEEAKKLVNNYIVKQLKINKEIAYENDPFYLQNKKTILSLSANKSKLIAFPTKINPRINNTYIEIRLPKKSFDARYITIDDIDSFSLVRKLRNIGTNNTPISEKNFKEGIKKIIKERGIFNDWGGERNDLFSTQVKIKGKRITTAFAFKGQGTKGKLTPKMMGKNGDQIQRLFNSPAEVFLIQYWSTIDESVIEQMKNFAIAKSASERKRIYYGVIAGNDTQRLLIAYKKHFRFQI